MLFIQAPEDSALSIANIIRHHETEYLTSLEVSNSSFCTTSDFLVSQKNFWISFFWQACYTNLPDTTFKVPYFLLKVGHLQKNPLLEEEYKIDSLSNHDAIGPNLIGLDCKVTLILSG